MAHPLLIIAGIAAVGGLLLSLTKGDGAIDPADAPPYEPGEFDDFKEGDIPPAPPPAPKPAPSGPEAGSAVWRERQTVMKYLYDMQVCNSDPGEIDGDPGEKTFAAIGGLQTCIGVFPPTGKWSKEVDLRLPPALARAFQKAMEAVPKEKGGETAPYERPAIDVKANWIRTAEGTVFKLSNYLPPHVRIQDHDNQRGQTGTLGTPESGAPIHWRFEIRVADTAKFYRAKTGNSKQNYQIGTIELALWTEAVRRASFTFPTAGFYVGLRDNWEEPWTEIVALPQGKVGPTPIPSSTPLAGYANWKVGRTYADFQNTTKTRWEEQVQIYYEHIVDWLNQVIQSN